MHRSTLRCLIGLFVATAGLEAAPRETLEGRLSTLPVDRASAAALNTARVTYRPDLAEAGIGEWISVCRQRPLRVQASPP